MYQIVKAHRGRVDVTTGTGNLTVFRVDNREGASERELGYALRQQAQGVTVWTVKVS